MSLGDLLRKEGIENMALHCIYSYREGGVQEGGLYVWSEDVFWRERGIQKVRYGSVEVYEIKKGQIP